MISAAEARMLSSRRRSTIEVEAYLFKKIRKAAEDGEVEWRVRLDDLFSKFAFRDMAEMAGVMAGITAKIKSMGFGVECYKTKMVIKWGE